MHAAINWTNLWGDLSAIVVILGGLVAFIKWVAVPALVHHVQKASREITENMQGELRPNGGASFRDHFDRRFDAVQAHLRVQDAHLESQDRRMNGMDDRMSHIEERVDGRA